MKKYYKKKFISLHSLKKKKLRKMSIHRKKSKKLGRFNRQLIVKIVQAKRISKQKRYHIVLAKRRGKPRRRLDKCGSFDAFIYKRRPYNSLLIDRKKFASFLNRGAKLHVSVLKLFFGARVKKDDFTCNVDKKHLI